MLGQSNPGEMNSRVQMYSVAEKKKLFYSYTTLVVAQPGALRACVITSLSCNKTTKRFPKTHKENVEAVSK